MADRLNVKDLINLEGNLTSKGRFYTDHYEPKNGKVGSLQQLGFQKVQPVSQVEISASAPAFLIKNNDQHYIIQPPVHANYGSKISLSQRLKKQKKEKQTSEFEHPTFSNHISSSNRNEFIYILPEERMLSSCQESVQCKSIQTPLKSCSPYFREQDKVLRTNKGMQKRTTVISEASLVGGNGIITNTLSSTSKKSADKISVASNKNNNSVSHVPTTMSCVESLRPSSEKELFKTFIAKRKFTPCSGVENSETSQPLKNCNSLSSYNSSQKLTDIKEPTMGSSGLPASLHHINLKLLKESEGNKSVKQDSSYSSGHTNVSNESKGNIKEDFNHISSQAVTHSPSKNQAHSPLKKINLQEYRARKFGDTDLDKLSRDVSKSEESPNRDKSVGGSSPCQPENKEDKQKREGAGKDPLKETKDINGMNTIYHNKSFSSMLESSSKGTLLSKNQQGSQSYLPQENLSSKKEACTHCGVMNEASSLYCHSCRRLSNHQREPQRPNLSPHSRLYERIKMKIDQLTGGDERKSGETEQNSISNPSHNFAIPKDLFYNNKTPTTKELTEDASSTEDSVDDPVVLTLSSDEDDTNDDQSSSSSHRPLSLSKTLSIKRDLGEERHTLSPVLSGGGSSSKSGSSKSSEEDEDFVSVKCKRVFVGSYTLVPKERLELRKGCFTLVVPSLLEGKEPVTLYLKSKGIVKILAHLEDELSVFVIYVKPTMANYVRRMLHMKSHEGPVLDPLSLDETKKRITIFVENIHPEFKGPISKFFRSEDAHLCRKKNFFDYLSWEEINHVIVRSCPTLEVENTSRSHSKQKSESLLVFPPPPNQGGITITTDDYYCLEEEQFLNDVIIDFYLQWLMQCHVSEVDRERTHVFSTFFYKRLTSKPKKGRRPHSTEDDPALSPAQKRHARVKSWTKSVDIFSKDFIFVPINEHSHWFLAVICFPGLDGPVRVSDGIPVPKAKEQVRKNPGKPKTRIELPRVVDVDVWDRDEAEGDEDELDEDEEPALKKLKVAEGGGGGGGGGGGSPSTSSTTEEGEEELTKTPIIQPCILVFDSLSGGSRSRIVATLRDYLSVEHMQRKGVAKVFSRDTMKGACPKVPQQMNFSDCGLFTLQFAQSFFEHPLKDFRFPIRTLVDWFNQNVVGCKREAIASLIESLMDELNPSHGITLPSLHFNSIKETLETPLLKVSPTEDKKDLDAETKTADKRVPSKSKPLSSFNSFSESQDSRSPSRAESPKEPKRKKITVCDRTPGPRPTTPNPQKWEAIGSPHSPLLISEDEDSGNQSGPEEEPGAKTGSSGEAKTIKNTSASHVANPAIFFSPISSFRPVAAKQGVNLSSEFKGHKHVASSLKARGYSSSSVSKYSNVATHRESQEQRRKEQSSLSRGFRTAKELHVKDKTIQR